MKLAVFGSPEEEAAFRALAKAFWPGPLTMVVKACDAIPLKGTRVYAEPPRARHRSLTRVLATLARSPQ